jgi:hypothetical protein
LAEKFANSIACQILVSVPISLRNSSQDAGKDCTWISRKSVDSIAIIRHNECNVQRWAWLVVDPLSVGNGAGAIGTQVLSPRNCLLVRWSPTNHYRGAAREITFLICVGDAQ